MIKSRVSTRRIDRKGNRLRPPCQLSLVPRAKLTAYAPPLSVIKTVKYIVASEEGGRGIGVAKILQRQWRPLSVIKIVKHCFVWGGGGHTGR